MMSTHEAEHKYCKLFRYCITERRRQSSPENILNIDYERLILNNQIHIQFMQLPYEEGQHEFTSIYRMAIAPSNKAHTLESQKHGYNALKRINIQKYNAFSFHSNS